LSRFDGYRFVGFGVDEGLPHRVVSTVIETRSGNYLVEPRAGFRASIRGAKMFARFGSDNYITALRKSKSGGIWRATRSGLFERDGASTFRRRDLPLPPEALISGMVEDPQGELWIGTSAGIYVLAKDGVGRTFTGERRLAERLRQRVVIGFEGPVMGRHPADTESLVDHRWTPENRPYVDT
jgi:hypothetical protein